MRRGLGILLLPVDGNRAATVLLTGGSIRSIARGQLSAYSL
jgi:hypothetical protein